ncbi:MAG: hypothetical protein RL672_222, partial [Actinomycetota bacterium]
TVTSFRQLAINASGSVSKGDRVLVAGKLRVRDWENGERSGTAVEVEAESIGHDLSWGSSNFTRTVLVREHDGADSAGENGADSAGNLVDSSADADALAAEPSPKNL